MAPLRVLVVEDDSLIRQSLAAALARDGYAVETVVDGQEAITAIDRGAPDLAIIDLALGPGPDGLAVIDHLRNKSGAAVVILSAAQSVEDRLTGFGAGVDDYVAKPFSTLELLARVRAVLKRTGRTDRQAVQLGPLYIDEASRTVTVEGERADLTRTEFEILATLVRCRDRTVSKDELLDVIWGHRYRPHLIETHMSSLRRKLGEAGTLIETVRSVGYLVRS